MARRNEITKAKLQRLAQMQAGGPLILSAYLSLDPERFATAPARATEVRSLIDRARRRIEAEKPRHDQREQLRRDLERVADHLQTSGFPAGAAGLAVFCCSSLRLFESLALPEPVESFFTLAETPFIAPLVEIGPPDHWCVTLVNRRVARVLRGSQDSLAEVADVGDNVHGQHSQGGWSQARYQRSVEHDVEAHLRHTAEVLLSQYQRGPFEGLLIGAPQELRQRFEEMLHSYVRERFAGYLELDVEHSTEEQVRAAAAQAIAEHQQQRVAHQLDRLRSELGRGGRAAAGVEDVMRALEERRVEVLLFGEGRGDGSDGVIEHAVGAAVAQDADVLAVSSPELGPLGGIAAVLRF